MKALHKLKAHKLPRESEKIQHMQLAVTCRFRTKVCVLIYTSSHPFPPSPAPTSTEVKMHMPEGILGPWLAAYTCTVPLYVCSSLLQVVYQHTRSSTFVAVGTIRNDHLIRM
ncbi:hypothetical protein KIL84_016377 [Mauremys mutica]|uniref:Uncharacterized protein n=1 Tax=Mauremys mutica TaxID=74926 RepID=A0A9D3X440_9SAUR|nr:hypothetical protein KIL84_016377 [Mauremys mutica]